MINKRDLLNINGLLSLGLIEQCKSKRKASEYLNTSLETFNKYIGNLENEFGVDLVKNTARGCILTPRGYELLQGANQITNILENIYYTRALKMSCRGEVRICLPLMLSTNFCMDELMDFFRKYPDLRIMLYSCLKEPNLETMGIDIGFTYFKLKENSSMVELERHKIQMGFYASSDFIRECGRPKDINDLLENYRIVQKLDGLHYISGWKKYIEKAKHVSFETDSTFDLIQAISNGAGIGLLPLNYKNKEGLVRLDHIPFENPIKIRMLVNPKTKDLPRVRTVIGYLKRAFLKL